MRRALLSLAAVALAGCIEPEEASPGAVPVEIRIRGDGEVACNLPGVHGCAPILVIEPVDSAVGRGPTLDDPSFETGGPIDGIQPVLGPVRNVPKVLVPGAYRLVGWMAEVNDMTAAPGQTIDPWVGALRVLVAEPALGHGGEDFRVVAPFDERGEHRPARGAEDVGGDRAELDVRALGRLVESLRLARAPPPVRPPNRTCDSHRIRLSTCKRRPVIRRPVSASPTARGSLRPGSDSA